EVPFVLRYDQKASASKMVSSITAFGYLTMAILYHWPFGGWKSQYRGLASLYRTSREDALAAFAPAVRCRPTGSQMGLGAMCGFWGIVRRAAPAESARDPLRRMMRALHHRGPDGDGVRVDDRAALGHTRLSIIDLSDAGRQPMGNEDGRYWITF